MENCITKRPELIPVESEIARLFRKFNVKVDVELSEDNTEYNFMFKIDNQPFGMGVIENEGLGVNETLLKIIEKGRIESFLKNLEAYHF